MRRAGICVAVLCLLAVAPASVTARMSSPARKCARVDYEAGGGYYFYASTRIRAKGARCSLARRIAHVPPEDVIGSGSEPRRFHRFGFVCRGRKRGHTVPFTCTRKRARVTFAWTSK